MASASNIDELKIEEYSEKSIVVRGNTKNHIQAMKDLGGLYNARLRDGPGWIFAKTKKLDVEKYIISVQNGEVSGVPPPEKTPDSKKPTSINSYSNIASIELRLISLEQKLEQRLDELNGLIKKLLTAPNNLKLALSNVTASNKKDDNDYSEEEQDDEPQVPTSRLLVRK